MTSPNSTESGRRAGVGLLLVLLLAATVRFSAQTQFERDADSFAPVVDSEAYLLQALRVARGHDLTDGVYFQAPLHPWLLGLVYRATGVAQDLPDRDVEHAFELPQGVVSHARAVGGWMNVILGLILVALVWLLGVRLYSPGVGLAAGLIAAAYGPSLFYEGHLLKVSLSLLFIPWAVLAAARAVRLDRHRAWIWCGLALGLGGLVRGNLHLLAPWAAAALLVVGVRRKQFAPAVARCGFLFLGLALALAPVVVRNSVVAGQPVLSTAAGGTAFWLCNHAGNDTGLVEFTALNRQVPLHEIEDWTARTEQALGRSVRPAEISSYWMGRALQDIRDNPARWLLVELRKLGLLFSRYEAPDNVSYDLAAERSSLLAWTPARYGILVPLALGGLWIAWALRRREQQTDGHRAARVALVLGLVGYAGTLLLFNMSSRFRMPVAVPLMVYAGYLLARLRALASPETKQGLRALTAGMLLLGFVLTQTSEGTLGPLTEVERASHRVTRLMNRAQAALNRSDDQAARRDLDAALVLGRDVGKVAPDVLVLLGSLDRRDAALASLRRDPEQAAKLRSMAEEAMRIALSVQPDHGPAHRMRGLLHYDQGAWAAAIPSFQSALKSTPLDRVARQYLTLSLLHSDRAREAAPEAQLLMQQRPEHDDGHGLAAWAAHAQGRRSEAQEHLQRYDALVAEAGGQARLPAQTIFARIRSSHLLFESVESPFAAIQTGREQADTILEVNGGGVALFDGDDDGDLDVLLVSPGQYPSRDATQGGTNRLYRNDGDWTFTDVTAGSGVDVAAWCNGVAVGDVNGDGKRDLYLTCLGPNILLRNLGKLKFEPLTNAAGAAGGNAWSTSAVFSDMDRDGDPDLYVVNYLSFDPDDPPLHGQAGLQCTWKGMPVICGPQGLPEQGDVYFRNDDGRFVEATESAGFGAKPGFGLGVLDGDFNGDGWPDLYVSNDSTPNFLFLGTGDGSVLEVGLMAGAALSSRGREQAGMGVAAGDLDGDLDEDLLVTNFSMEPNALYRNNGTGRFEDTADPSGIGGPSRRMLGWGVGFLDVDLDGDLDVLTANGHVYHQADAPDTDTSYAQADLLLLNDGRGRFTQTEWPGSAQAVSRALAVGDLDDDGIQDVVITRRFGPPMLWRGLGAGGQSVSFQLRGPAGNPDGVGLKLEFEDAMGVRAQQVRVSAGFQASSDPRPAFAWRGPGTLRLTRRDGTVLEQGVRTAGRQLLDLDPNR